MVFGGTVDTGQAVATNSCGTCSNNRKLKTRAIIKHKSGKLASCGATCAISANLHWCISGPNMNYAEQCINKMLINHQHFPIRWTSFNFCFPSALPFQLTMAIVFAARNVSYTDRSLAERNNLLHFVLALPPVALFPLATSHCPNGPGTWRRIAQLSRTQLTSAPINYSSAASLN